MAMDGMSMMLKSMGIDKDKIEGDLLSFKNLTVQTVNHFDARFGVIEQKQELCYNLLLELRHALLLNGFIPGATPATVAQAVVPQLQDGSSHVG